MPKVASTSSSSASGPHTPANVLKRNQACHQCRKRKLKCDAKRPCSTCVRSHAHAVTHAPAGGPTPIGPECTFDEIQETQTMSDTPKNKYERLENRISELEALLRQKESTPEANSDRLQHSSDNADPASPSQNLMSNGHSHALYSTSRGPSDSPRSLFSPATVTMGASNNSQDWNVLYSNYPPNLPGPELLRHLVEVFFLFHPHASRMFHPPTFMASLSLPPSHPRFPVAPILYSICAVGSLYTGLVTSPPLPNLAEIAADEIFLERHRSHEERPDSFAEQQIKLAKEGAKRLELMGQDLLQALQAYVICCWFYTCHSKHVELFTTASEALRLATPLGLNMCPPFNSITVSHRPVSLLAPARSVVEDEMRRNVFWLAYAEERQHGCANGWAHSLDDQDISQLLPLRGDQYQDGKLVTPHDRQFAHSKDVLLVHPHSQIDPFILYVKSTMLLSRVKTFNMRFRVRHFNGDENITTRNPLPRNSNSSEVDARMSTGFIELDTIASSFLGTFPPHFRNPIMNNTVDNHLFTSCLITHVATIILHDPHADVRQSGCISALKILTSARAILDLIYAVWSTSYDITLLDPFCSFCWLQAGRVLVRFLQAALEASSQDQVATLRAEIEFILNALKKVGQRYAMAYRSAKVLEDLMTSVGALPTSGIMTV